MKVEIVKNGSVRIILIPEDGMDQEALTLLSKHEIEHQEINNVTQILDSQVDKGLIIRPRTRNLKEDEETN
jgi:hypothetical protein